MTANGTAAPKPRTLEEIANELVEVRTAIKLGEGVNIANMSHEERVSLAVSQCKFMAQAQALEAEAQEWIRSEAKRIYDGNIKKWSPEQAAK